jgi:histone H3/H4
MAEYISWSPIRRLMKHNGALIVARDAVNELVDWMSTSAVKITKSALTLTKHSKRKKITRNDILLAIKYFK